MNIITVFKVFTVTALLLGNLVNNSTGDERKLVEEILRKSGLEFQPHEYSLVTKIYTKILECLLSVIRHLKQSINHSVTFINPEKKIFTNLTTRAPTESRTRPLRNEKLEAKVKAETFRTTTTKTTTKPVGDECGTSLPYPHQSKFLMGGGAPVRQWEMPWAVYLKIQHMGGYLSTSCGGTLISKRHVVTAAHCLALPNPSCRPFEFLYTRITVYYGGVCLNNLYPGCTSSYALRGIRVKRAYAPHFYKQSCKAGGDIAFLELEHEIDDRYARPICLSKMRFPHIRPLYVFGWGRNHLTSYNIMNNLQKLEVQSEYYDDPHCYPDTIKCFRSGPNGESAYSGDSGGGLIGRNVDGKWNLVGVFVGTVHKSNNRLVAMVFVDMFKFFGDLDYFLKSNVTNIYYFF